MVLPIWKAAGLDPNAVEIMIVQDNSLNAFVAGGQRIFINTGLIMRTETPNQLIGVLAHESGHIAGGHLTRMQEELRALTTLQILEMILAGGAMAGSAASGGSAGRGGPTTGVGSANAPGSLLSFLHYTQTQENAADQAAITFLQRTGQSPKGAAEFLRVLQKDERMQLNHRDPYLTTHPLTPDRITAFDEAVARSPYANKPDSPQFLDDAPSRGRQADGLHHPRCRPAALRRSRPVGAGALRARHRLVSQGRAGLGAARHRRPSQGISERSLLPRGARPDAVRERPRRRGRALLSPRRPASAEFGGHQDRLCPCPARHQQSRQRPRGRAQPRTGAAAGIRHASTCGA